MKKFIIMIIVGLTVCSATFVCSYNEKTHKFTACESFLAGQDSEKCAIAHKSYKEWIKIRTKEDLSAGLALLNDYKKIIAESEEAKKLVSATRRVGNAALQYVGDKLNR